MKIFDIAGLEMRKYRMTALPWYQRYDELRQEVEDKKNEFETRCAFYSVDPKVVLREIWIEIIARAVHESNWQEGLYLDEMRTRELVDIVFNEPIGIQGPHLDIQRIVDAHRNTIIKFKRNNASVEEIATFNLSLAHRALELVGQELAFRQAASLVYSLHQFKNISESLKEEIPSTLREMLESPDGLLQKLLLSTHPTYWPLNVEIQTQGELLQQLLALDFDDLLSPMRLDYIHFFHRLTMMGMLSPDKCGVFRTISVNVGDPDVFFPPPSLILQL